MWRSIAVGVVLAGMLAGCSLGSGSGSSGGATGSALEGMSLVAQQSPNLGGAKRHWTTTQRLSLNCGTQPSAGDASGTATLCDAVAYYSHHVPTKPCIVRGVIVKYRRVLISGKVNGHRVQLAMGLVCNPPPKLSRAVQAIYSAAFPPLTGAVIGRVVVSGGVQFPHHKKPLPATNTSFAFVAIPATGKMLVPQL
jgi:hypothetical protein